MYTITVNHVDPWIADVKDATVDHIDAGQVLDMMPSKDTLELLRCWRRKLVPRGTLDLRVTDFDRVVNGYKDGSLDAEQVLCGDGSLNRAIFNQEKILMTANMAGFEIISGEDGDLSWRPTPTTIGLRLTSRTRKAPEMPMRDIHAVMSLPRVSWTETMGCVYSSLSQLGIEFTKATGVFWSQGLQRLMSNIVDKEPETKYILTIDFDSIFDARDIIRLWQIMEDNPDIVALCPMQIGRDRDAVLMTVLGSDGRPVERMSVEELFKEAIDIGSGHFGLTLIRTEALKKLPKPWFLGTPNKDGDWGDGRIDDDIHFWKAVRAAGGRICATPKVRIGHLQLVISWPTSDLKVKHQYIGKYFEDGRPDECTTY
jgi:hypothetical protein